MGGPDLTVNYDILGEFEKNLTFVKQEFVGLSAEIHKLDNGDIWGSDEVKGAMDGFQNNWSIHREKLEGSIDALLKMVTTTTGYFQQADQELAKALHGDNNPSPAGSH